MMFNPLKLFSFLGINDTISKVFVAILAIVLVVIVLPNTRQIYEKLGFKTVASVEKELAKEKTDKETVIAINKVSDATVKIDAAKDAIVDIVITDTVVNIDKAKEKKKEVVNKRDKRIKVIIDPGTTPVVDIPSHIQEASVKSGQSVQDLMVSEANIDAIWESFQQTKRVAL